MVSKAKFLFKKSLICNSEMLSIWVKTVHIWYSGTSAETRSGARSQSIQALVWKNTVSIIVFQKIQSAGGQNLFLDFVPKTLCDNSSSNA